MSKVFDFNANKLPCAIIGRPRELAWPCSMFRVTLPKFKQDEKSEFNAFELCVLKLLAYGRYEPKILAEETCLPCDLIEFILLRLFDRELIDEYYQLQPSAKDSIEKLDAKNEATPTQYETYVLFRESVTGKFLPFIKDNKGLKAEEVKEQKGIVIKGRIRLSKIRSLPQSFAAPTTLNVISILRTMARQRRFLGEEHRIPSGELISVSSDSENCSLRVRMVIQQNSDWRILNPFGLGWSLQLESAYKQLLEQSADEADFFQQWQEKNKVDQSEQQRGKGSRKQEPYETQENYNLYPELIPALVRDDVYAALEWALFYALQMFSTREIIQMLQVDTSENNASYLEKSIKGLSLEPVKPPLLLPTERKLLSFQDYAMAEMQVVLPLVILMAQAKRNSSFRKIIQVYPDLLSRIFSLKSRRDKKGHGKTKWNKIYGENDFALMRDIISTLLPSVVFSERSETKNHDSDTIIDVRFNARFALQNIFGIVVFDRMDTILQENLLQTEIFRQEHTVIQKLETQKTSETDIHIQETGAFNDNMKLFDALIGINLMYAAVQCAFRPLLVGERPVSISSDYAAQKVKSAGLGELPESLCTVRLEMLQRALDGNDLTLGASVVAWLLLADDEALQKVASAIPDFLSLIDSLLKLRGHGNQVCMMQGSDFEKYCQAIYKLISIIMEV